MKKRGFAFAGAVAASIVGGAVLRAQDMPEMPPPPEPHAFLTQFVGEWVQEGQMQMSPEDDPIPFGGAEKCEMLGGWMVMRGTTEMMGMPFTAALTLGWLPDEERFVGTWIDSGTMHLWNYTGSLDSAGKKLTLYTEGPSPFGGVAEFRETIEFVAPDHRVFTSSQKNDDGGWTQFVEMHSRKKK